jgi:hypothetical protein
MLRIFTPGKNPTASAGFEPAILGTRGQHANHQTTEAADPRDKLHSICREELSVYFKKTFFSY